MYILLLNEWNKKAKQKSKESDLVYITRFFFILQKDQELEGNKIEIFLLMREMKFGVLAIMLIIILALLVVNCFLFHTLLL